MGKGNNNSKNSAYGSELENYIESHENFLEDDFDFNDESKFQTSGRGSSKLDEYLGVNDKDDDEDEEINYCSICGKELKKFNYGDKCDDCIKKIELVGDINKLLDYISPSEELNMENLLFAGFDELKLNIIISNLLDENLIIFGSNGIYLADVKTLNNFFRIYGSSSDLLDESLYKNLMFSDGFVDISKYSDLVEVIFNSKNNKWEVNLYRDGRSFLKKFFTNIFDANDYARLYLKEIGELDNLHDKKPIKSVQEVKRRKSRHKFVFFSVKRNQWFVKVKGVAGSKIVGFYETEDEAVKARDDYLEERKENRKRLRPKKFIKDEADSSIKFHERSNQWVVIVKRKRGGFKKLGFYDTEEEAIAAKNEYYGIGDDLDLEPIPMFNEGDRIQVTSGIFEFNFGIITGYNEDRDSFIVKLENSEVPLPVFIKSDQLKLI